MSVSRIRQKVAVVVPTYFQPQVPDSVIRPILEGVFADSEIFVAPERTLAVVDRETRAEAIFRTAGPEDSFSRCQLYRLERNRGKAGAIESGLRELLATTDAEYIVTRDCDGDHVLEDIPRMVGLADSIMHQTGNALVVVMGGRASLEKPMGWVREEWERYTNHVLVNLIEFGLARMDRIFDRRFLNGQLPDIQSGYRVYSRAAAERAVHSLEQVPERKEVQTFACEFMPFADLAIDGAVFGQIQRQTLVEQPVSSYQEVDFAGVYGSLLAHMAEQMGVKRPRLLEMMDSHLPDCSLFFTDLRNELVRCRRIVDPDAPAPILPPFL